MRLDKFLKLSRLVKRRPVANELCDGGNVLLDGKTAKAASTVKTDQELTLLFGNRTLRVRIERVPQKNVPAQEAASLYTVLEETRSEPPL